MSADHVDFCRQDDIREGSGMRATLVEHCTWDMRVGFTWLRHGGPDKHVETIRRAVHDAVDGKLYSRWLDVLLAYCPCKDGGDPAWTHEASVMAAQSAFVVLVHRGETPSRCLGAARMRLKKVPSGLMGLPQEPTGADVRLGVHSLLLAMDERDFELWLWTRYWHRIRIDYETYAGIVQPADPIAIIRSLAALGIRPKIYSVVRVWDRLIDALMSRGTGEDELVRAAAYALMGAVASSMEHTGWLEGGDEGGKPSEGGRQGVTYRAGSRDPDEADYDRDVPDYLDRE